MFPILINSLASMAYSAKNIFKLVCLCTCLLFIAKDVKDMEKWQKCRQYIIEHENMTQDLGPDSYYDVCLYSIGKLAMRYMTDWWSEKPASSEDPSPASCFSSNNSCVKGKEFCRDNGCQPLFPNNVKSDDEKRQYCLSVVLRRPVRSSTIKLIKRTLFIESMVSTEKIDACYYVLGVLSMQDRKGGEKECPNVVAYQITVAVLAAVLVCILTGFVYHKVKQCRNCDNPRQGQGIELVQPGNPDDTTNRQNEKKAGKLQALRQLFSKKEKREGQNGEDQRLERE